MKTVLEEDVKTESRHRARNGATNGGAPRFAGNVRRWAAIVGCFTPTVPARASPIDYSSLSDTQLFLGFLVGMVATASIGTLGVIGFVRHWRAYRRTGEGLAPWVIVVVVGGVIGAIALGVAFG